jgi:hypothetical protein
MRVGWVAWFTDVTEQHVRNRQDFSEKFFDGEDRLRIQDVWRELKGTERRYTYFPRGTPWGSSCDRVDMIIGSKRLFEARHVLDTGILDSVEERGQSEYVPLWVEVSVAREPTASNSKSEQTGIQIRQQVPSALTHEACWPRSPITFTGIYSISKIRHSSQHRPTTDANDQAQAHLHTQLGEYNYGLLRIPHSHEAGLHPTRHVAHRVDGVWGSNI